MGYELEQVFCQETAGGDEFARATVPQNVQIKSIYIESYVCPIVLTIQCLFRC